MEPGSADDRGVGSVPLPVPDAIEPVTGWRYWRLNPISKRLRSLTGRGPEWHPGQPLRAGCRFGAHDPSDWRWRMVTGFTNRSHRTPGEGCTCGIYAARDLRHLRGQMLFGLGPMVVGEVALWGKVIPGDHGYRAEFAYPRRLRVIQRIADTEDPDVEALTVYGVPVDVVSAGAVGVHATYVLANFAGRMLRLLAPKQPAAAPN